MIKRIWKIEFVLKLMSELYFNYVIYITVIAEY
jgi:hypothetical protein